MLTPYVHQATLLMSSEADLDAPGAAIGAVEGAVSSG
ncbi:hypothetical protein J2S97_004742 [Arthrobacter oryzae]|nr:hypothetical protein [Arthrobacter oryzae]